MVSHVATETRSATLKVDLETNSTTVTAGGLNAGRERKRSKRNGAQYTFTAVPGNKERTSCSGEELVEVVVALGSRMAAGGDD